MSLNEDSYAPEELTWTPLKDMTGRTIGVTGAPTEMILGPLVFVDGWAVHWGTMPVTFNLEGIERAATMPAILFSIPDYPDESTATYLIPVEDAERMFRQGLQAVNEAKRVVRRNARVVAAKAQREEAELRRAEAEAMSCSHEHCRKQRRFFDEEGRGWCKKHAEERGIREHGKV